jgi:hypothetical protein
VDADDAEEGDYADDADNADDATQGDRRDQEEDEGFTEPCPSSLPDHQSSSIITMIGLFFVDPYFSFQVFGSVAFNLLTVV